MKIGSSIKMRGSNVLLTLVGSALFCASAMAGVSSSDVAATPGWSSSDGVAANPNCSILSDYRYNSVTNPLDPFIDQRVAAQLRQQYDDLNRNYEIRRDYGLMAPNYDEQVHAGQISDLGHNAMQRFQTYEGEKVKKSAEANPDLQPLMAPAAVMGGAMAVYRGTGVNLYRDGDIKVRAKASFRNRTTGLELNSPLVHGSLDMTATAPSTLDPTVISPLDPAARAERYRLSLSRLLPFDFSSGLSYGTTTSTMSASLSRKLTNNLTAVVGAAKTMDPSLEAIAPSEQSLRFLYGLSF
ncbi:MAG: hypothetical protein P4M08_00195 [Oligoflexia bacterium]|nr:hypothetical protein [Oligoflexia bacterium]